MLNPNSIAHTVGVLSLVTSLTILFPTLVNTFKITTSNSNRLTLKISHLGILLTICLGLIHGLLITQNTNIDFYKINTYWIYGGGLFVFNLLIFLAFTFSELKRDLKKLNYFNYAVLLLLVCHVGTKIIF
ncbi:hypothetical protein I4641_08075 [Waterburya agarophytonicola K14]|uniref:Uncharacterized protein n=1 Tax=Waterburya agarophytonicola KI4 TaxID=2874699 RepID=A0A964FEP7_9CYAN|nr:hypothetical protein [Waterburya agarophytonicola]MCC0176935.1 hypothetical protein [Waterburya agarophytonicola KI4]